MGVLSASISPQDCSGEIAYFAQKRPYMVQNPALRSLGLSATDRAVIIHTDDIGVSAAATDAARELWQARIVSSSAVMAPCAWFAATAQLCRETPWIDMGVHITLTSEWDFMRWGPISTRDPASGLLDPEGFFFRNTRDAQAHATVEAAAAEMDSQVQRALAAGIDVTHIDTHMGSAFHPKLLRAYVATALKHRVPPMLARLSEADMRAWGRIGRHAQVITPRLWTSVCGRISSAPGCM